MNNHSYHQVDPDKYNLVFDIIDHPENYSSEKLKELMSDAEIREIYNLLCKTISATNPNETIDVENEWKAFAVKYHSALRPYRFRMGGRAASVALVCFTSLAAVAVSVAVIASLASHKNPILVTPDKDEIPQSQTHSVADTLRNCTDSLDIESTEIIFEDNSLEDIIENICRIYSVKAKFLTDETSQLHLYYRLDPTLSLNEIILQLNTFERINITHKDSTIIID